MRKNQQPSLVWRETDLEKGKRHSEKNYKVPKEPILRLKAFLKSS
jgi:hypothetical protein